MLVTTTRTRRSGPPAAGFTLIELLVVIGIIGILIATLITVIPKVKRAAAGAQTSAQLSALSNAIQQYFNDFKAYPGPLSNDQLGSSFATVQKQFAFIPYGGVAIPLTGGTAPTNFATTAIASKIASQTGQNPPNSITGTENLVLGLLGGLRVNLGVTPITFEYHPEDIFPDGVVPSPRGAQSLSLSNPRKSQAYIQVRAGDLSVPDVTKHDGLFTDSADRYGFDSQIPEFLDKYSEPLPILYYRANPGAQAIAGYRNTQVGSPLLDANGVQVNAQYDLWQNAGYTGSDNPQRYSTIGTVGNSVSTPTANPNSVHGLRGLGTTTALSDTIDANVNGKLVPSNNGSNGVAYFKDPSANAPYNATATVQPTNTTLGVARQKDGYLLISAGPDRLYGTSDDVIFPGPLVP